MKKVPFSERIINLFFPSKCVCCGEVLTDISYSKIFCRQCFTELVNEETAFCSKCGKVYTRCTCKPTGFIGADLIYAFPYCQDFPKTRSLILSCKKSGKNDVFAYISRQIILKSSYVHPLKGDYIVTYVPRNRKKELKYGVDQARELAKQFSSQTGFQIVPMFTRNKASEQKKLDREQRKLNAENAYSLSADKNDIYGRNIILVDDIVTTGATMNACSDILYQAGANEVICVSSAKSDRHNEPII